MAIQRIETFTSDDACVVRVETDDGDVGFGQTATGSEELTVQVFHKLIAPYALETDPIDVSSVIDSVLESDGWPRPYKYPGTFLLRALCGLDTALWDLAGKREGKPVCELLGGGPTTLRAYGSRLSRETTVDEEIEICQTARDEHGLEAFKLKIGKRMAFRTDEDVWPGRTEAVVSGVREALGDDVDLLVDANCAYSAEQAIAVGKEVLEPNNVIHFEEPCPYWEFDWLAEVRETLDMPVAGGEQNNMTKQLGNDWERIIDRPVLDIVQPDIGYVGGITRTKHIADMAAAAGLPCVPHGPNHTLQKVFTLHLLAAIDNAGAYPFEYKIPNRGSQSLYTREPTLEDGQITVPTGPGWGVELNPDWLARSQYDVSEA
ncbi:mandelate racemase/muconate lactonizing enzyme family protein [Natronolimnobius sp. AArcel1]|uniref:mandelate racemase/muconate lactonizing enzyme family protein n=1 Tax=Natronolimnobius sp. AArcel1 TaxID=1679093 RepID=UPI0013EAEB6D|nr:mandelate racemase/muconate lactonizing enzyme family protein [Natronolimnobius sp. AArcel1]NGM68333.1 mandelate racemase/muconate lactonizing enzyme family protein [Natronolimnobius sp. AArcel1]